MGIRNASLIAVLKHLTKEQLKEEKAYFGSLFEGRVHHDGEAHRSWWLLCPWRMQGCGLAKSCAVKPQMQSGLLSVGLDDNSVGLCDNRMEFSS